jgi:hypothetical protein
MACSTKKENQIEKLWNNGNTEFWNEPFRFLAVAWRIHEIGFLMVFVWGDELTDGVKHFRVHWYQRVQGQTQVIILRLEIGLHLFKATFLVFSLLAFLTWHS